jgi:hypothetical protein
VGEDFSGLHQKEKQMKRCSVVVLCAILTLGVAMTSTSALADVVPFTVNGMASKLGNAPQWAEHWYPGTVLYETLDPEGTLLWWDGNLWVYNSEEDAYFKLTGPEEAGGEHIFYRASNSSFGWVKGSAQEDYRKN